MELLFVTTSWVGEGDPSLCHSGRGGDFALLAASMQVPTLQIQICWKSGLVRWGIDKVITSPHFADFIITLFCVHVHISDQTLRKIPRECSSLFSKWSSVVILVSLLLYSWCQCCQLKRTSFLCDFILLPTAKAHLTIVKNTCFVISQLLQVVGFLIFFFLL